MPIQPVAGPAGAGKSQYVLGRLQPGELFIDFTRLWAALGGYERGPDGRYPIRRAGDPLVPLTAALRGVALSMAIEREYVGWITTASRDEVPRLEKVTGRAAVTLDPGEDVVRRRLTDAATGQLPDECEDALGRWF